ncbi:MAG: GH1 family beta-glucosidase [Spirochaetota bacterium]|nr:GH1 family beta-glucosidase [Spirochaetota bacterium]
MECHDRIKQFPEDFLWGTATASYQVEGAVSEGGRTPSIWDTFSHTPGRVAHGHTGDTACDQYHRYREDVRLMRDLGAGAYRFSLSWSRILPNGGGKINEEGVRYYRDLIAELQAGGIEPVVTLYHWDLPQELEDAGGWTSRATAERFSEYAQRCFELFPEVKMWISLNEPFCSAILGYLRGVHAPGIRDHRKALSAVHHLLLAHGTTVRAFRRGGYEGKIGITLNMQTPRPATIRQEDEEAADRAADLPTRMFLDPILGKKYPQRYFDAYPGFTMPIRDGDMKIISERIDFLGVNFYWEDVVVRDESHPEKYRVDGQYQRRTAMGWPVTPEGLYRHLVWISRRTGDLPLFVTENGAAFDDSLSEDGLHCHDPRRIEYLRSYLDACRRAIDAGVPLKGYFLWSFIDNFEWSHGYEKRFGIVYCDYNDQQRRIPKDSFYFYRDVINGMERL